MENEVEIDRNKTEKDYLQIKNIVGNSNLGKEVDLDVLEEEMPQNTTRYENKQPPGLFVDYEDFEFKNKDDSPTAVFFRTGSFNLMGIRNFRELEEFHQHVLTELNKIEENEGDIIEEGFEPELDVHHRMAVGDIKDVSDEINEDTIINLGILDQVFYMYHWEYEPDEFCSFRLGKPESSFFDCAPFHIFKSGKVVAHCNTIPLRKGNRELEKITEMIEDYDDAVIELD